jgi:hypothetical protein
VILGGTPSLQRHNQMGVNPLAELIRDSNLIKHSVLKCLVKYFEKIGNPLPNLSVIGRPSTVVKSLEDIEEE